MPAALIPLILEYVLKYGVPAAVSLINTLRKDTITWEDWLAVFAKTEEPYGLTAQLTGPVTDLGVIVQANAPTVDNIPAGIPPANVIVRITGAPGNRQLCNAAGNCWQCDDSLATKSAAGSGAVWTFPSGLSFYITREAISGMAA